MGSVFWCFFVNFAKFAEQPRTKGVLANDTVNYEAKTKAHYFASFKPLSYRFKETIGFNVKALFASRPTVAPNQVI